MDELKLEALVDPSWNNPPRLIGDLNTPHGNNSNRLAPPTGFPAMTVPMGFTHKTCLPGLQLLGRPWSEPDIDPDRLRLRAGDPTPPSSGEHATASRNAPTLNG
jgi:hypothetical protein